ncbi:hypothetical protein [Moorena sp. SIO3I6]|uniref:hypothetical protein n=1 Tax=Moorena sp. SIO3I6 TaxID=2607831 RepID=UPI0013FA6BFD|nr:hypothetical protein [Moorena sp. SIO3I6]NEP25610.1 hypothetical protein [Moorena sp. SIO3I6]
MLNIKKGSGESGIGNREWGIGNRESGVGSVGSVGILLEFWRCLFPVHRSPLTPLKKGGN